MSAGGVVSPTSDAEPVVADGRDARDVQRVCVLANRYLLRWQVEALERMVETTGVDVPLVVVNETGDIGDSGFSEGASDLGADAYDNPRGVGLNDVRLFFELLREEGAYTFVLAEKKLSWMVRGESPPLMRRVPLDDVDVLDGAERVHCRPVPVDGAWCDLPEEVVDRIADETDVAIRFGFNLLTGDVLARPAHGVLSFHPADVRRHRGIGPAQPFLADEDTAGATLQQLTDELDGGNVVAIEHVDISDAHTLDEVRRRVNELQVGMLAEGIERLRDPTFDPAPPETLGPYTSVKNRRSPAFAGRILAKNLRGRLREATSAASPAGRSWLPGRGGDATGRR